jgi:ubiquinone/menaquinone biosynthesis C-methylase UbiE
MAELRAGEKVLDVACGTGLVTLPAAEAVGPDGHVTGTDISEQMVLALADEAKKKSLEHVSYERLDAEDLRLPDDGFDAALCALGLMYFPEPIRAMVEMHRVLRPGGRCVAAVWGERKNCGWAEIFPIVDSRVESEVCPLFFQLGTGEALRYAFEAGGFTDIRIERLSTILEYETAEDACGAAFAGGPVALAYSRFDEETREAAHAEYIDSISGFRNGNGYEIPGEFVVGLGRVEK